MDVPGNANMAPVVMVSVCAGKDTRELTARSMILACKFLSDSSKTDKSHTIHTW